MKDDVVTISQVKKNTYRVEIIGQTYSPYGELMDILGTTKIKSHWDSYKYKAYVTFQAGNFEDVLTVLRMMHNTVIVQSWHNTTEKCNTSCQNAEGNKCTCSCLHKNHGKPDARYKSVQPLSDVLIKTEWVQVSVTYNKRPEGEPGDEKLHADYEQLLAKRHKRIINITDQNKE